MYNQEIFNSGAHLFLRVLRHIWDLGFQMAKSIAMLLQQYGIKSGNLLDLGCGIGRVAIPLAKMGYNVIGVDRTKLFIDEANLQAKKFKVEDNVKFINCDYSQLLEKLRGLSFDGVISVWTSIGFGSEEDDVNALKQALNLSNDNAILILEVENKLRYAGPPKKWVERYDDLIVYREGFLGEDSRWRSKWTFYSSEGTFLGEYGDDVRFYSSEELVRIVEKAGWSAITLFSNIFSLKPFNPDSNNIVLVAKKL